MKNTTSIAILMVLIITLSTSCNKDDENGDANNPESIATSIELLSGSGQQTEPGEQLPESIVVIVKDQNHNSFSGAIVSFAITEGLVSENIISTNSQGKAIVNWTLGPSIGQQFLTISALKSNGLSPLDGSPIIVIANAMMPIPPVTDIDGNTYPVIQIGTQLWMAKNLATTKYNDGADIPNVTDNGDWSSLSTPAYCWHNNDELANKDTYGALYNWFTVETQKLCPIGWHVPTDNEWAILINNLGGASIAGGKLKEAGYLHWNSPNTGATNEFGFEALPCGNRRIDGSFFNHGTSGEWWSSTASESFSAWCRAMYNDAGSVDRLALYNRNGFTVRCVKD
jgi:uncharacterized protein (TIGR02145 family)